MRAGEPDWGLQKYIRVYKHGEICKKKIDWNLDGGHQWFVFLANDMRKMPFHEGTAWYAT
jgi:hypothetical protein